MALQIQGNGGTIQEVGGTVFRAGHSHIKPLEYGALGHYKVGYRLTLAAAQTAGSRIFAFRNAGTNIMIPTRLTIKTIQSVAGTAQVNGLELFRCTGYSVTETTNTVTPTVVPKRTSMGAGATNGIVRGVTVAGAAAGMTGATRTPDASPFESIPIQVTAAVSAVPNVFDMFDDVNGTHPFYLVQNEGFEIQNRVLNVTSYGVDVYITYCWAEVTAF